MRLSHDDQMRQLGIDQAPKLPTAGRRFSTPETSSAPEQVSRRALQLPAHRRRLRQTDGGMRAFLALSRTLHRLPGSAR